LDLLGAVFILVCAEHAALARQEVENQKCVVVFLTRIERSREAIPRATRTVSCPENERGGGKKYCPPKYIVRISKKNLLVGRSGSTWPVVVYFFQNLFSPSNRIVDDGNACGHFYHSLELCKFSGGEDCGHDSDRSFAPFIHFSILTPFALYSLY
jgi:hypothetical protein